MKLMTHTSLFWITMSMVLFFLYGIAFYFVFKELSVDRLDKELSSEMELILDNPERFLKQLDFSSPFFDRFEVDTVSVLQKENVLFSDSTIYNHSTLIFDHVRFLRFGFWHNDLPMEVTILKSTISSDKLTERIVFLISVTAILFALGLYLLNRHIFSKTWGGFYSSLKNLKSYNPGELIPKFEENEIDEFEDLNIELRRMIGRISADYHNLQSFTSNTTHEFQTPLAVIQSKAELLMQNSSLSEDQLRQVNSIDIYARQLSRITKALSLLFKIDNQQFQTTNQVNLKDLIVKVHALIQEQCIEKRIEFSFELDEDFIISINNDLADILVNNLLRNAVIHNYEGGLVKIIIQNQKLEISNTGDKVPLDKQGIFKEFEKGMQSNGLGLGLAICQRIAQQSNFELVYQYENHLHSFVLKAVSES